MEKEKSYSKWKLNYQILWKVLHLVYCLLRSRLWQPLLYEPIVLTPSTVVYQHPSSVCSKPCSLETAALDYLYSK